VESWWGAGQGLYERVKRQSISTGGQGVLALDTWGTDGSETLPNAYNEAACLVGPNLNRVRGSPNKKGPLINNAW
jgi:hypothetical protein